jgi:hypothetical protein
MLENITAKLFFMKNNNTKYDELYLNILRIGQSRVDTGLSYDNLRIELIKQGYDFENDCIELAVKQWFYDSFYHRGKEDNPYNCVEDLEKHLDCSFILKGDSCLRLIEYDKAHKSNLAGWISLILSLLAIFYSIFHDIII